MKRLLPCLLILVFLVCATTTFAQKEKKDFVMYAEFMDDTLVQLSDGSQWMMDKGDCFPIHMFKERQTVVVLQLAGAQFSTEAYHVRVLHESDSKRAAESYRKMVENYYKAKSKGSEAAKK